MTMILESKTVPSLRNSAEAMRRFPFPFSTDSYGYWSTSPQRVRAKQEPITNIFSISTSITGLSLTKGGVFLAKTTDGDISPCRI